jgi:hypothetical protein
MIYCMIRSFLIFVQNVMLVPVPDRRRRILLRVILVGRWVTWVLGILRGEGLGKGLGKVSLQAT